MNIEEKKEWLKARKKYLFEYYCQMQCHMPYAVTSSPSSSGSRQFSRKLTVPKQHPFTTTRLFYRVEI